MLNRADLRTLVDAETMQFMQNVACAAAGSHEVGGILLGSYRGDALHVTGATKPQLLDRFSFTRFLRSDVGHQKFASRAWRRSKGLTTYVGEWHSHPEDYPNPSSIDRADWHRKVAEQQRRLAFIIIGYRGVHVSTATQQIGIATLSMVEHDESGSLFA